VSKNTLLRECLEVKSDMAMGTKQDRQQQEELFYAREQAEAPGHPFYQRFESGVGTGGLRQVL
jgi:hypothetical protein